MYSGNAVAGKYRQNPYFEGVLSAITTQGEVTANVRADRWEIERRRKNASSSRQATSYPGGELFDNLHIMPHELIFGWTNQRSRFNFPGEPAEIGFSSLNGVWYGEYDTDEELMDNLYFIGVAKTPFVFDSLDQLKHGFAAIRVGSATTFNTGDNQFFSGDIIEWSVVPRPSLINANFSNGEFGGNQDPRFGNSLNTGGRQGYPRYGTPRGKFRFILKPAVRGDMRPGINGALSRMLKDTTRGGVVDMPVEALYKRNVRGNRNGYSPYQHYAKSTIVTDIVGACRVLEVLYAKGLVAPVGGAVANGGVPTKQAILAAVTANNFDDLLGNPANPNSYISQLAAGIKAQIGNHPNAAQTANFILGALVGAAPGQDPSKVAGGDILTNARIDSLKKKIEDEVDGVQPVAPAAVQGRRAAVLDIIRETGVFDTNRSSPNALMRDIMRALYVDFAALGPSGEKAALYTNFGGAFARNGRDLVDAPTDEVRYVNVALNYANIRQGAYDKAVAHKTRRHIGMALSPSEKGQRLDGLFGHFLNAGNFSQ